MVTVGDISDLAVAAGTGALALFTWKLAKRTAASVEASEEQSEIGRAQVAASEEQARLAAAAITAAVQPMLVSVHASLIGPTRLKGLALVQVEQSAIGAEREVIVPLRNIGPGVALLRGLSITTGPGVSWAGSMTQSIVAVGEQTLLRFTIPTDRPELGLLLTSTNFEVHVSYTDVGGERMFRSLAFVHQSEGRWLVRQVFVYRDDSSEPFATSGPADG